MGCRFFSTSDHAREFFSCPGFVTEHDAFPEVIHDFNPDVVVCDTFWPQKEIAELRRSGVHTALILRMTKSGIMCQRLRQAVEAFNTILIPHHPEELLWTYRNDPAAIRYIESLPIGIIGPLARTGASRFQPKVIFTLGGGGQWRTEPLNADVLKIYSGAIDLMMRRGYERPAFSVGPLMKATKPLGAKCRHLETNRLYEHFGRDTIVIARGGYNVCWEAIAARSLLIYWTGSGWSEDVEGRGDFFRSKKLARVTPLASRSLFQSIVAPRTVAERSATDGWSSLVNTGIRIAVDELLGGSFLRAREPERAMKLKPVPEIDILAWPGPRLRNELRIWRELRASQHHRLPTRAFLPPGYLPQFVMDYWTQLSAVLQ